MKSRTKSKIQRGKKRRKAQKRDDPKMKDKNNSPPPGKRKEKTPNRKKEDNNEKEKLKNKKLSILSRREFSRRFQPGFLPPPPAPSIHGIPPHLLISPACSPCLALPRPARLTPPASPAHTCCVDANWEVLIIDLVFRWIFFPFFSSLSPILIIIFSFFSSWWWVSPGVMWS